MSKPEYRSFGADTEWPLRNSENLWESFSLCDDAAPHISYDGTFDEEITLEDFENDFPNDETEEDYKESIKCANKILDDQAVFLGSIFRFWEWEDEKGRFGPDETAMLPPPFTEPDVENYHVIAFNPEKRRLILEPFKTKTRTSKRQKIMADTPVFEANIGFCRPCVLVGGRRYMLAPYPSYQMMRELEMVNPHVDYGRVIQVQLRCKYKPDECIRHSHHSHRLGEGEPDVKVFKVGFLVSTKRDIDSFKESSVEAAVRHVRTYATQQFCWVPETEPVVSAVPRETHYHFDWRYQIS